MKFLTKISRKLNLKAKLTLDLNVTYRNKEFREMVRVTRVSGRNAAWTCSFDVHKSLLISRYLYCICTFFSSKIIFKQKTVCIMKYGAVWKLCPSYYVNFVATFNYEYLRVCGDIFPNPGPNENDNANSRKCRSLGLVSLNCRSLLPRIDELTLIFKEAKPGIIAITETWLDDLEADHEIHIAGYNIIRKDRQFRRGGGCAIYSEGIKLKHRQDLEHNEHEVLWG